MINNRQGGRRRGRGGQRGPNLGGMPGNRQDNRQRGNAAQLLEKYKSMARDSQLAGDRVQTEYYLQFADHYFRVLSESRARFEDQRRPRGDNNDEDDGDEELAETAESDSSDGEDRHERHNRQDRGPRPPRRERSDQRRSTRDESDESERDNGRGARMNGGDDSLSPDVLPPSIGADEAVSPPSEESPAPRPRRRARTARPAEDEDAPVA
ncbi:MAG TPA: DUF4167 domain-containing protein [Sphingomicrobium sp.]|nr:DUF4167 domain-containing protein [Sphingomicrobium sp.]